MLNIFKKYSEVNKIIDEIKLPFKKKLLYLSLSILSSLIIISGLLTLFINMLFIFANTKLIFAGIIMLVIIFFLLIDFMYLKLITKGEVKDIRYIYLIDTAMFFVVAWIIYIFLIVLGVF